MVTFLWVLVIILFLLVIGLFLTAYVLFGVLKEHDERLNRLEQPFNY